MKFLLTIYRDESKAAGMPPGELDRLVGEYQEFVAAAREAGVLLECEALHPTSAATTVQVRDGERLLTDGPFAETKEQLGGFVLLDGIGFEEAIGWAARIPGARTGAVEVRAIQEFERAAQAPGDATVEVAR